MTTIYYTPSGNPGPETRGISAQVRAEFQAIASSFVSVSSDMAERGVIAGQTWTGTHTFPATTYGVTAAFGSSGNAFATLDYVNTVATNAALPGQAANADRLLSTSGTTALWANTINVSVVKFVDGTDKTKQVQIDASGITTGTTRTITIPDRAVMLGGFANMVIITTTGSWTAPAWCSRAQVAVQDGGTGSQFSTGGSSTAYFSGSPGGNAGISIVAIVPGASYTATPGAGSAASLSPSAGGTSSFSGPGITTLTSANASLKVPGASGTPAGTNSAGSGGGTLYAPTGSVGYGAGGQGGNNASSAGAVAGQNGCIVIYY
jgi:hypothetical protein